MSAEREALREAARDLLDDVSSPAAVRALVDPGDDAGQRALWGRLAEVGWAGIEIDESHGGAGAGLGELAVVLTELGAHLTPAPLLATAVLGAGAFALAGTDRQRAEWLPRLADGSALATVAVPLLGAAPSARLGTGGVLTGSWRHVPDADVADVLVLPARDEAGDDVLVLVAAGAAGLSVVGVPALDLTRRLADVTADGVAVLDGAVLCSGRAATRALERLRDRAALAVACDSLGLADRLLAMTTGYVAQRVQFDRPVGSFQSVKHDCTDMLIDVETARMIVDEAVRALESGDAGASTAVAMAKSYAADAAARVAASAMALHGGIGFTWEHDLHLYLKRAKLNQALVGSSRAYRRRVADLAFTPAPRTETA